MVKYSNNDVYRGGYYKGKKEGKGRYEFASGDVYEGYFEQGVPSGQGKLTFKDGGHFEVRRVQWHFNISIRYSSYIINIDLILKNAIKICQNQY